MEQYVKYPPMTERQIEWMQEQLFREYGPFYHLSTKPLENGVIFQDDEERKVAIISNSLLYNFRLNPVIPGLTRNLKTTIL